MAKKQEGIIFFKDVKVKEETNKNKCLNCFF